MIAAFAYDKNTSPINMMTQAEIERHEPVQYMARCSFSNVYWDFDRDRNYAPHLVFEGEVNRMDAIDTKFPGDVDTIYFGEKNKPAIRYRYDLNEDQCAELAKKGFWSEDNVQLPAIFTTAVFELETYAVVEEVMNGKSSRNVPILNIELVKPYENQFDISAYELVGRIMRCKPDEQKVVQKSVPVDVQQSIIDEIETAKAKEAEQKQRDQQVSFKQLTPEELEMRKKSANIGAAVAAERDAFKSARDAGNARAEAAREAEKARIEAEQSEMADVAAGVTGGETVKATETDVSKLTGGVEQNKFESNSAIFDADSSENDTEMPDKAADFMKKLGAVDMDESVGANSEKKDDKRGESGSGAASGAQGLGVYTFEDQSTAQFEMRADEGKGNEKPGESEEKSDSSDDAPKPDNRDVDNRKAKLATSISDTTVSAEKSDDKSDRSK